MSSYNIRLAKENDCDDLLQLIKDFAEFENRTERLVMTADVLKKNGFGENPKFQCLVAQQTASDGSEEGGSLIGYSFFNFPFSPSLGLYCFMEDLYVKPQWRGKGVGTALMKHTTKMALDACCIQFLWSAWGWNKQALEFYKHQGAVNLTETKLWHCLNMTRPMMEEFVTQSGLC